MLRAMVGLIIIAQGLPYLIDWSAPRTGTLVAGTLAVTSGICLVFGFLTPVAVVLVVIGSLGFALSNFAVSDFVLFEGELVIVNVIVISVAIALLGPGAFSLDARMFGRREISIPITAHRTKISRTLTDMDESADIITRVKPS